jgi:phosphocarrier protein HPr
MITKTLTIINRLGLHARASSKLVSLASSFNSEVTISKDNKPANLKSIMGVMMLAASKGSQVTITVLGNDEHEAMAALENLIENKFDEAD